MIVLNFLTAYWRWVAIGVIAAAFWVQQSRIDGFKVRLAEKEASYQTEQAARQAAARDYETKLSDAEGTHAKKQQTNLENFNAKIDAATTKRAKAERDRDLAVADAGRVRKQLDVATSTGDNAPVSSDTSACRASKLQLAELGQLAGETAEALAEGEKLVDEAGQLLEERDIWVGWAAEQMKIDRLAVDSMLAK